MHTDENELLITRFKSGESEAFDRLMSLHMDQVFGLAWSVLHDREAALDATQEVFIKLHAVLPKFDSTGNLPAWLYRVCLNHCIDIKRKTRNVGLELTEEEWDRLQGSDHDDPGWFLQNAELREVIKKAVDNLPPRQRSAFVLRHYNFMSLQEIAETMGCTVGAVKAHLARATGHLRVELAGYVGIETERVQDNGKL
ncbi:MAG TPA: RNA polymerase sigma factor [Armatimonadota bacterium]|nr:RNA polymerase sigma factor [Armatimonadota bacterium]HPP75044.1 RNA polymerase sigma factor [Armatimonadota bacterium]